MSLRWNIFFSNWYSEIWHCLNPDYVSWFIIRLFNIFFKKESCSKHFLCLLGSWRPFLFRSLSNALITFCSLREPRLGTITPGNATYLEDSNHILVFFKDEVQKDILSPCFLDMERTDCPPLLIYNREDMKPSGERRGGEKSVSPPSFWRGTQKCLPRYFLMRRTHKQKKCPPGWFLTGGDTKNVPLR